MRRSDLTALRVTLEPGAGGGTTTTNAGTGGSTLSGSAPDGTYRFAID